MFIAVDQEGGDIASAPWVAPEPAAAVVGRGGDPDQARGIAARMGRQLLGAGINTDLAPVVDTGHGAAIGNRSFGEDPELVSRMGSAAVEGFERAGVVSAAKHFPNHGAATSDSHPGLPVIRHDEKMLRARDLPPFQAAIEAGVPMVMVISGHRPRASRKPLPGCHRHVARRARLRRRGRRGRSRHGRGYTWGYRR